MTFDSYRKPSYPDDVLIVGYVVYWIAREQEGESAEDSFAAAGQAVATLLPKLNDVEARAVVHEVVNWMSSLEGLQFAADISEEVREAIVKRYTAWADGMDFAQITPNAF